jgi:hypothetical protein
MLHEGAHRFARIARLLATTGAKQIISLQAVITILTCFDFQHHFSFA